MTLGAVLRRFFAIGTFGYDGRQYGGPNVQKITPIRPNDEFYQVSTNLVDPDVSRDSWRLDIIGEVENPRVYSFTEIAAMPAVEQETTLLCISYGVGSGLCSNAIWKGVPLPTLLAQVKPKPDVSTILFRAADGYYETFRFQKAMEPTTLLAYEMNGEPLPQRHGYPLRMIVPGLYGEKNPKWLTRIELLNEADARLHRRHGCGFYKEQGWGREGDVIPTHSRIDAPQSEAIISKRRSKWGSQQNYVEWLLVATAVSHALRLAATAGRTGKTRRSRNPEQNYPGRCGPITGRQKKREKRSWWCARRMAMVRSRSRNSVIRCRMARRGYIASEQTWRVRSKPMENRIRSDTSPHACEDAE